MADAKQSTPAATASTSNPAPAVAPSAIEAIEEDDEFEEFEPCQWDAQDGDADDSQQWKVRFFRLTFSFVD